MKMLSRSSKILVANYELLMGICGKKLKNFIINLPAV